MEFEKLNKAYSNNEEQLEAIQADLNKYLENYKNTLSEEDKQKYKTIENAVEMLTNAGVLFYLFPLFDEKVFQFNNVAEYAKGKFKDEKWIKKWAFYLFQMSQHLNPLYSNNANLIKKYVYENPPS